ncbi:MAG TPA: response regulator [Pseudomonadales bacterium]
MGTPLRVLIVDDSSDDTELVLRELRRGSYDPEYRLVDTPEALMESLESEPWDVILCDFTMPGFTGNQALSLIRSRGFDTPFIFVSGTIGEEVAVAAMKAGAQDYVIKDNLKRLVPAIERELREVETRRERARAEEERREAEYRLKAVLTMAPDAIIAVDEDQHITIFNHAAESLFGYSAEEVIGRPVELLLPTRAAGEHRGWMQRFGREPPVPRRMGMGGGATGRRKNGEEFPLEASISKFVVHERLTYLAILRDVTQQRALEEQLRQAQKMEAVGQLTGGLAHDFNNLLTVIMGHLELLIDTLGDNRPALESARTALEASLRGARLTRQLLAFARRQTLQPTVFDVGEMVTATADLIRRTLGAQIRVELDLAEGLPPVVADQSQVESAVVNLAINGRDAMPDGGLLTIATGMRSIDAFKAMEFQVEPGDYLTISVTDTGIGIPPEALDKVFDPFYTTKEQGYGTGLGLSMVFGFVKQSGGHVEIESRVGEGTTVRLYLPPGEAASLPASVPAEEVPAPSAQIRVLVVEDNPSVRALAARQLETLGYSVLEAEDGPSAIALLEAGQAVDLLFTDLLMPGGMSGLELVRAARRLRPELAVLLTSGNTEAAVAGADPDAAPPLILAKPYRKEELARKIREALNHQRT